MKTITLKPEFEKKLKGVKGKFVKNLVAARGYDGAIKYAQGTKDWKYSVFLLCAFAFDDTPEKSDFWNEISNR